MVNKKKTGTREGGSLSLAERETMMAEYLSGGYSKAEVWKKYTGQEQEHGQLLSWIRNAGIDSSGVIAVGKKKMTILRAGQNITPMMTQEEAADTEALREQVRELKKQLELSELKAEGYRLMVELAESQFNIPIVKKSGTR